MGNKAAQTVEEQARERVANNRELKDYAEIILDPTWPNWTEHMQWVATAPISEIVDWAEMVEADIAEAE